MHTHILLLLSLSVAITVVSPFSPTDHHLINCGTTTVSTTLDLDHRTFTGDASSPSLSSSNSIPLTNPNPHPNSSPLYHTARLFTHPSHYKFNIQQKGTHLIRLHFFKFDFMKLGATCHDQFHVSANGYVLLHNFSALKSTPMVKDFLISVDDDELVLRFFPVDKTSFAFVNAIEVISAPKDLIDNFNYVGLDQSIRHAYETVYRVSVGGVKVTPFNDSLWRNWVPDDEFLKLDDGSVKSYKKIHFDGRINYQVGGASREVGPDNMYNSARLIQSLDDSIPKVNMTWVFPVKKGFSYVVRLHFCDIASISIGLIYFNMASDEEDFVFIGTPIEREEDTISRKKKSVAEASGQLRTLVPWKQEVRDEEGRRRFHGAFSGGFSAGYFNTVGSKEGWTPQTFTSSRKKRAEIKQQDLSNFLDDDEKAELEGNSLGTSMQFDTFGFTAAEIARKQSEKEQNERPSAIPGPAPDELVVPATDPIGVRLMLKMGWRRGQSVKSSKSTHYDARREARKAFLAFAGPDDAETEDAMETAAELPTDDISQFKKSTPVYVLNPKQDMHGLGYDPFKGAPEFRDNKRSHLPGNRESGNKKLLPKKDGLFSFKPRNVAPGFGIGALEELDAEDEDVYASGYDFEAFVEEVEEPSRLAIEDKKKSSSKQQGVLPGFKVASNVDYQLERFDPPVVPKDFVPHHKFPATLQGNQKLTEAPPPEVPPPVDNNLKVLIEGVATLVARCGTLFEELSREKNQSNPLFNFLNGGDGNDYYKRKLWEARQKHGYKTKPLLNEKVAPEAQKMTAETRGNILGEKPLNRTAKDLKPVVPAPATDNVNLQYQLSDTFTEPASFVEPTEIAKPFQHDPAKQERFEQYLKEKYRGGLRTLDAGGSSKLSEAARARERLEFEAAAEAMTQGKWGKEGKLSSQQILGASAGLGLQFTSGGSEINGVSQTEEVITKSMFPKREEFQWRPAPILCKRFDLIDPYTGKPPPPPRSRSKLDSLIFMPDYVKAATEEKNTISNKTASPLVDENRTNVMDAEAKVEVEVENVERPVDLYKAIFSDDSDDEEEDININQQEDPTKKIEVANTALSRLVAGDFLESLGKELGLEVPPDQPYKPPEATQKPTVQDIPQKPTVQDIPDAHKNVSRHNIKELNHEIMKKETKVRRDQSSSEDEKNRKRSKRDYDSTSDSSDGYRDRHSSSRHKGRKKEHRKHSKHRHHESSSRSRHSTDKEYRDSKRERRKRRD